jgi:hypothetical protein
MLASWHAQTKALWQNEASILTMLAETGQPACLVFAGVLAAWVQIGWF